MSAHRVHRPTEPISIEDFDELYGRLKRWSEWSKLGRGAWNRLGPEHVLAAAKLVRSGRVITTALPWATKAAIDNPKPALHFMTDLGDVEQPEPSTHKDFLGIDYHGKSSTHLDALAHIAYHGELFGGVIAKDVVGASGSTHGSVAELGAYVGRGVLLDMPVVSDERWLEPGQAVYAEDILAAEDRLGFSIGEADAVLLRTGHKRRRTELAPWDSSDLSAGLHASSMELLADRKISLLGSDGDSDVRPSPVPGVHSPVHILALTALGVPLLDNLDLEVLSAAAADEQRYEFLFTVQPLNVETGTGSPVNPLAVF